MALRNWIGILLLATLPALGAGPSTYKLPATTFTGTVTAPGFVGPLTGNASTATALEANPSPCTGTQVVTDIAANGTLTCASVGDVVGPSSATDLAVVKFDGTTGKLVKNSGVIVDASDNVYVPGKIGIGQSTPKALLHIGSNTTSGTVGTGALILGKIDTTQNLGAYSVVMGGNSAANYSIGTDNLAGGSSAFFASGTIGNIAWGNNVGSDSSSNYSAIFGESNKSRAPDAFVAGALSTVDFGATAGFLLGTRNTVNASGASLLSDNSGNSSTNSLAQSMMFRHSGGWRRVKTSHSSGPAEQTIQDTVATTDATVTTLQSFTTASNQNYLVEAWVNARRTGGTAGTTGDGAGYMIRVLVKNIAGTVTANGVALSAVYEDQVLWDATIDISGTAYRVRVTGATDNNITWTTTTTQTIL